MVVGAAAFSDAIAYSAICLPVAAKVLADALNRMVTTRRDVKRPFSFEVLMRFLLKKSNGLKKSCHVMQSKAQDIKYTA